MRLELFTDLTDEQLAELLRRSETQAKRDYDRRQVHREAIRTRLADLLRAAGVNPTHTLTGAPRQ